jgi:hypothetical protein
VGAWCNPDAGCLPLPDTDAGVPDGSVSDAETDASVDSAVCPEDPCRLVAPQCGCASGEMCARTTAGSATRSCVVAGTTPVGAACTAAVQCSAGSTCVLGETVGSCLSWCASDADCPAASCLALRTSPEVGVCTRLCDPLADGGCAPSLSCYAGVSANLDGVLVPVTLCTGPGSRATGEACMASWQCVPRHICSAGGTCEVLCDVDAPACTPCSTIDVVVDGVELGFCG